MAVIERIRHRAAISGHVVDAVSRTPIAGARVSLVTPAREFRTRADGFYFFIDLPDGNYALRADAPAWGSRYGSASVPAVAVGSAGNGSPLFDPRAEIALPPTRLTGTVRRSTDSAAVPFTEVRLSASGDKAVCDKDGRYVLFPVEAGAQGVRVLAPGFAILSASVTLNTGQQTTADFTLTPL